MRTRIESGKVRRGPKWIPLMQGEKLWAAQAQGTFPMRENGASTGGSGESAGGMIYLDPADTPRLRLVGVVAVNNVAPTSTFTFRLRPLGNPDGGAAAVQNDETQTAVSGASVAFVAPAANSAVQSTAEFDCPAAGFYVVDVQISVANMAASSAAINRFRLDVLA